MRKPSLLVVGPLLVGAPACGGLTTGPLEQEVEGLGCEPSLSAKVQQHSCQHARLGPHREILPSYDERGNAPDVSRTHTTFHVLEAPAEGGFARFAYRPSRQGEHVVFVFPQLSFEMLSSETLAVEPSVHEQPEVSCSELSTGRVFDLTRADNYELEVFVPPAEASPGGEQLQARVFIEHLGSFDPIWEGPCPP